MIANENGVNKTINWKLKSLFEMRMAQTSVQRTRTHIRTNQWLMSSLISIFFAFNFVSRVMNAIERMTSLCRDDVFHVQLKYVIHFIPFLIFSFLFGILSLSLTQIYSIQSVNVFL